jgi:hypothetical protein
MGTRFKKQKGIKENFPSLAKDPYLYGMWGTVTVALLVLAVLSILRYKNIISF